LVAANSTDIGTYIIVKDNCTLSQIDEIDDEGADELMHQFSINREVKDVPFNANTNIENLVKSKKIKLAKKYDNDSDNSTDYDSDILSDSNSYSDSEIENFITNYEKKLRTVSKSDRITISDLRYSTINYKSLTSNTVLKNVKYCDTNVEKNYTYYVNNDNDYLNDKITKLYKYAVNEKYFSTLRKKYDRINFLNLKDKQFQAKCINKFKHLKYTIEEYDENINKFKCPNNFTKITYALQKIEKINDTNISIQPSQLGETLKTYTINKLNFPVIENMSSNYKHDIMLYDLTYGYIPTVYLPELEILIKRLVKSRTSQSYDIIEGELEMLVLGYWKLDTQDLKHYNDGVNREDKKNVLSHILYRINKKINNMPTESCSNDIKKLLTKAIQLVIFFGRFRETRCITALSLVYLKNNIITMLTSFEFTDDVFEGMAMLFSELNIHNLYFPHTHNILIRNRDTICQWLFTMTNIHNLNNINEPKKKVYFITH